jgi:tRNA(adenine34) deaminase
MSSSIFGPEKDSFFMQIALEQALLADAIDEVPIGAIVVDAHGAIIARAYNQVEKKHTQRAHAEMEAVALAGAHLNDWRLMGCWVYVNLEPCSMCMAFMRLSRVAGVVYGASSPLFGYRLDNGTDLRVYKEDTSVVIGGVRAEESAILLKQFFKKQRVKKSE